MALSPCLDRLLSGLRQADVKAPPADDWLHSRRIRSGDQDGHALVTIACQRWAAIGWRDERRSAHSVPRFASALHLLPLYASGRGAPPEAPDDEELGVTGSGTATLCFPMLPVYDSRHNDVTLRIGLQSWKHRFAKGGGGIRQVLKVVGPLQQRRPPMS